MALHLGNKKIAYKNEKKTVGQLRRAQLITTFGSGAIADMPDYSVVMAATNYWTDRSPTIHEPSLERLLGVSCFKQPYASENHDGRINPDIPAFRFPIMHFCPGCGKLMPYWGFADQNTCKSCNKRIVPSRFIAACINGHLEDFPYRWWVHGGDYSGCEQTDKNDKLVISFSDESGGLDSIVVKCTVCGRSRSMAGSLSKDSLRGYRCRGRRPWIGQKAEHNEAVICEAQLRGLQRGASNVYFSVTASALTIPPWSNRLHQEINKNWDRLEPVLSGNPSEETLTAVTQVTFESLIKTGLYPMEVVISELKRRLNPSEEGGYSRQLLMEDEYRMFCVRDYDRPDDYQFRIEGVKTPESLSGFISDIVLARRLREVLALRGFRRISPDAVNPETGSQEGYGLEGDCVPLSDEKLNWLPAIEMLGEGIFIRLDEDRLAQWEEENKDYYKELERRLENSLVECENFSSRYVLLHTLSHLLIRQLSVECGYSGASIKERIYSTYQDSEISMSGILLYTSTSDSDGSLGGLVRKGLSDSFEEIFYNMLNEATWCSSDPICIESRAQGYESLNYAACHACTLLPETSCEMRNCLLDRGAVVGSITDRTRGYFGCLLDGE